MQGLDSIIILLREKRRSVRGKTCASRKWSEKVFVVSVLVHTHHPVRGALARAGSAIARPQPLPTGRFLLFA